MGVTLVTQDRELEDKMLVEYPGKIFEKQYKKLKPIFTDCSLFIFKDLDQNQLEEFLKDFKDCNYTLYSKGKPIIFNKPEKFKINWQRYFSEQTYHN